MTYENFTREELIEMLSEGEPFRAGTRVEGVTYAEELDPGMLKQHQEKINKIPGFEKAKVTHVEDHGNGKVSVNTEEEGKERGSWVHFDENGKHTAEEHIGPNDSAHNYGRQKYNPYNYR